MILKNSFISEIKKDRYSKKMATEGAGGDQPPPVQTLATAVRGSIEVKCEFNMDNLSKPELLTLLSIMEGELEARDLVIEALRARRKEVFIQERYGHFSLADPFLALQRDFESGGGDKDRRAVCASPISVLEAVMAHCKKMQERMSAQLAAAESRQKKLEQEKAQLQSLQQEHRKLSAQLKDEREKNKHMVGMLVRECKQLAARVVEESQRFEELSSRLEEEGKASGRLEEELAAERQKGQQMEAEMEKQLSELDTEREQLRARLGREEARAAELRAESEGLRRQVEELRTDREASSATAAAPKATVSVAVGTDPVTYRAAHCQTDLPPAEPGADGLKKTPVTIPVKPSPASYAGMSLPKSAARGVPASENGPAGGDGAQSIPHSPGAGLPAGVSPRVQAARYKFQASEQDQNGTAALSPPSRDLSPTNRDSFAAKQQARHTVTQVLSRFTSPPAGGALRPNLPHSASEGGPFAGRLGHPQVGLKSPTAGRIDRGNPPPIPPKKPGLSQTPSPPHPPSKWWATAAALTASQVGARPPQARGPHRAACADCPPVTSAVVSSSSVHPVSASSCRPCDSDSPLAAASGWCPSIVPSLTCGGPVPLADGHTLLLQAATQGNVTLLSMLLNPDPMDICHPDEDGQAALNSAAENGHTDCVKLLLAAGVPAEVPDKKGFTPLHTAAAQGHSRCVEVLVGVATDVDRVAAGGQTALFLASGSGSPDCVRALLDAGADRALITTDGWTTLHAAASSGQVASLELLLYHPFPSAGLPEGHADPDFHPAETAGPPNKRLALPAALLNHTNRDGWTAAHIAASKGFKNCLEVLCGYGELDIEKRDKCKRTIHDVATDDCKDLLENLNSYRVLIRIQRGSDEQICTVDMLEDGPTVGAVTIHKRTGWEELSQSLSHALSTHFHLLSAAGDDGQGAALGLSTDSVSSVLIGDVVWQPGQALSLSPWDLIRKRHCQHLTVRLKGLWESSLEELAYDSLIPLQLLQNYVRLVEQYRNVVFHGLEGSCQDYIASQISHCIKHKQEAMGVGCDIIRVEVDENLTKEQLVEVFINCGFLVPVKEAVAGVCVVVLLEGLERARSLSELLGDLCEGLENRGSAYPLPLLHVQEGCGPHHFKEDGFLIGTLSKSRLHGAELLLQQHFRWVQLRWDSEPLTNLLTRHLSRKLVHKMRGQLPPTSDMLCRTVAWVCAVWRQLNSCLSRLGTPEALIGPQMFFSCPVVPDQAQAIFKWLSRLWNMVVVPRVEEAIVSRVTLKRSSAQRLSPGNKNLSPGQQAVVKAALSILVNKAILQGCPLPRPEIDKHLSEFQGGSFPLSALGSYKGGARKGREGAAWRRASTSPRKKGSPASTWSSSGTLREGSRSSTDLCFGRIDSSSQRGVDREPVRFSLCSDDETDLMQELQTMCSSRSEPDISKIAHSQEDLIVFPASPGGPAPPKTNTADTAPPQTQTAGRRQSNSHAPGTPSSERRTTRPKSQLPVPSSKNLQQAHSAPRASSSTRTSSRTRQVPPINNNNQSQEEIWILNRDLHENNN
ncbi:hypothetical protein MATL_G00258680 [Megalops atlanticus]|uniref:Cortactin-binding protein 2 n=1 Tax=Megalops atlanticus TaxID=7932 RepID=A0A9D3P9S2_MEGAT|nr:hypothetical protein MATL_G00258680 [Megalops atlanticus]